MIVQNRSKTTVDVSKLKSIAAGGEGTIYTLNSKTVLKIYHTARPISFSSHLESLSKLTSEFIKPIDIFYYGNTVAGFTMDYVNLNDYYLFNNLFNKMFCTNNNVTKDLKIKILLNLKVSLQKIHDLNIQIGDLNQYNIFFNLKGEIKIIDIDSFQTPSHKHSNILLEDIQDYVNLGVINNRTDEYAFAVLSFWTLTHCHPYKWIVKNFAPSLAERVCKGLSFLNVKDINYPKVWEEPVGDILNEFYDIFVSKSRKLLTLHNIDSVTKQITVTLQSNALFIKELFNGVTNLIGNMNYIAINRNKRYEMLNCSQPKVVSIKLDSELELFPSTQGLVVGKSDSTLISNDKKFSTPLIDHYHSYHNGNLCILQYTEDIMYSYNLNNQIADIDHTNTVLYSKSIQLVNGYFIQNFGREKYLMVPNLNSFYLLKVPSNIKNVLLGENYIYLELKDKSPVHRIYELKSNNIGSSYIEFDQYVSFTEKGTLLFVPNDNTIDIYSNCTLVSQLECPVCTKNSILKSTVSGILLLENSKLYLINKK